MKKISLLVTITLLYSIPLFSKPTFINYTYKNDINFITIESDTIWTGTTGGVVLRDLNGHILRTMTTADGLSGNHVLAMVLDLEGNRWFATDDCKACRFNGLEWKTYSIKNR